MPRLQLTFTNLNRSVLHAAKVLVDQKLWKRRGVTDPMRVRAAQKFCDVIVRSYSTVPLTVKTGDRWSEGFSYESHPEGSPQYDFNFVGDSLGETPDRIGVLTIPTGRHWNTLKFFFAVRDHMLFDSDTYNNAATSDQEKLKQREGWVYSLFYSVRPIAFRKLARQGKIEHVKARDTFSTETAERMTELGLLDEQGDLTIPIGRLDVDDLEGSASYIGVTRHDEEEDREDNHERSAILFGDEDEDDGQVEANAQQGEENMASLSEEDAMCDDQPEDTSVEEARSWEGDGLDGLGIVAMRKLSKGKGIKGAFGMDVPTLRSALREKGVRA